MGLKDRISKKMPVQGTSPCSGAILSRQECTGKFVREDGKRSSKLHHVFFPWNLKYPTVFSLNILKGSSHGRKGGGPGS